MWNDFENSKKKISEHSLNFKFNDAKDLRSEILAMFDNPGNESFSTLKQKAISHLLSRADISLCPDNIFVYNINHSKIMHKVTDIQKRKVKLECDTEQIREYEKSKAFKAMMDFGHVAPDWNYVLEMGINSIITDLENRLTSIIGDNDITTYYTDRISTYKAIREFFLRYAEYAREYQTEKTNFIARNLTHLADHAPESTAQALQLILLFYFIQTHIDTVIVRSLGGLDRMIYPYYEKDLRSGRYTKEELKETVKYFLWTISCMKVTANMPFYICGMNEDGNDATNEFTSVILEAYRELDIYDPKIHVLYHESIDKNVLSTILEMIREGKNSFVFINTNLSAKSLERLGIDPSDAKRVIPYGCYEPAAEGNEVPSTCAGLLNLAKSIELVLNSDEDFDTFDEFYNEVIATLLGYTRLCMDTLASYELHYSNVCPSLIMSPTYKSSRESGIDVYSGGAKYNNTSVVGAGLATLVDALVAVKHVVYEEKLKTLDEFREILISNWEADPKLRMIIQKKYPKFGNNNKEADDIARDVHQKFADIINGAPNGRGGVFRCGMFSVDWRFGMGKEMSATPDGRYKGEPISKNLTASIGQDKSGVTAFLNSVLNVDSTKCPDGYVADVQLHSSAVKGIEGMEAFKALLISFMNRGGFSVHFNVLDPETLIKAQKEPENYKNLQIRLCGWNVLFVDLDKQLQDEFIKRNHV